MQPPQPELFDSPKLELDPGAWLLRGFALERSNQLLDAIGRVVEAAPLRHMITTRGWRMSVAMSNCGNAGWLSDRRGYRYDAVDPETGLQWPAMPKAFAELATEAAAAAGYENFHPDACLVNRYEPGAKLSLHQDRNERDFEAPIVSVSLGLPATFLWGGATRASRPRRVRLEHGDVVVWGGPTRLHYHGVDTLQDGLHPVVGAARFNLTFRNALRPPPHATPGTADAISRPAHSPR
jgi:alkylated DNA repair protein (DNA oxidative demethylase)